MASLRGRLAPLPATDHRLPKTTTVTPFHNSNPLINALAAQVSEAAGGAAGVGLGFGELAADVGPSGGSVHDDVKMCTLTPFRLHSLAIQELRKSRAKAGAVASSFLDYLCLS
jgi:hypothetical protein